MVNILGIIFMCANLSVNAEESENSNQEIELDVIDAEALEILNFELKDNWGDFEETYEQIRRAYANFYGFTSVYLYFTCFREFSSSPKISALLKLAEVDLKKGTSIGELVYTCCQYCPNREAIRSLIGLGHQRESEVVSRVFEFEQQDGSNCLIALFNVANFFVNMRDTAPKSVLQTYKHRWDQTPAFLADIEESIVFLIRLARSANLDLDKILNHPTATGETLFQNAAFYSQKIAKYLLKENVQVNSITDKFVTPTFQYESLRQEMVDRGANPFVRCSYTVNSDYEGYNLDYLSNLPSQKSVYFITRPLHPDDEVMAQNSFLAPWRYKTGVFDGKFVSMIGKQAAGKYNSAGIFISGYWFGKRAAYKFVRIGTQEYLEKVRDSLRILNVRYTLGSMIDDKIISSFGLYSWFGHYRQQFHADDDQNLAGFLNLQTDEVEDYDVFVFKLCEENISKESAHGLGEDKLDHDMNGSRQCLLDDYDYDDVY